MLAASQQAYTGLISLLLCKKLSIRYVEFILEAKISVSVHGRLEIECRKHY